MIKLQDSQIAQILPEYLSDRASVQALSFALYRAVKRLVWYCGNIGVFAVIDTAPDYVLDMLAIELNTQYYDDSLPLQAKRRLIRNTMVWYMSAGTPQAVEELVAAVFGDGEVAEWFEYGDDPYYFKIATNAQMTPEMNAQFSMMLERVKNARSHIRAIEIHRTVEQVLNSGACVFPRYKPPAIIDGYGVEREVAGTIHAGIADGAQARPAAILDGFSAEGEEITAGVFAGATGATRTHQAAIIDGFSFEGKEVIGQAFTGGEMAATEKQAAIREGLEGTAAPAEAEAYTGTAVRAKAHQKPPAIREALSTQGETVTEAIVAATASHSKYKNTVKEGGTKNATTI